MEDRDREPPAGDREPAVSDVARPHVAFVGKAGSGKTTASELLVRSYGYKRLSFAGLLKDIAVMLWGAEAMKDRDKLQKLGEYVRNIDEDAWANALFRQVDDSSVPVVIDDCRFPNELWGLRERAFVTVRIEVPEELRVARLMRNGKLQDREQLYHVSETALDGEKMDHTIYVSDDDLPEYEAEIDRIVRHVFARQP